MWSKLKELPLKVQISIGFLSVLACFLIMLGIAEPVFGIGLVFVGSIVGFFWALWILLEHFG